MPDIKLNNIKKSFHQQSQGTHNILNGISLDVNQGDFTLIQGHSGSGKTTLLMSMGGLLLPDEGYIYINRHNIAKIPRSKRDEIRAEHISFIFQNNILLNELNVLENILFPLQVKQKIEKRTIQKALHLIDSFGIFHLTRRKVAQLSGGEKQTVNFIRGILPESPVILADEPTSEMNSESEIKVLKYLKEMNSNKKVSVVLISHSPTAFDFAKDSYRMEKGKLIDYKKLNN